MPDEVVEINKKHLFEDFTTRKYYAGYMNWKLLFMEKISLKKV